MPWSNLHLQLQLPDPAARSPQLGTLARRDACKLATVDAVLTDPLVQTALADTELDCDSADRSPGPHQRYSAGTELGWIPPRRGTNFVVELKASKLPRQLSRRAGQDVTCSCSNPCRTPSAVRRRPGTGPQRDRFDRYRPTVHPDGHVQGSAGPSCRTMSPWAPLRIASASDAPCADPHGPAQGQPRQLGDILHPSVCISPPEAVGRPRLPLRGRAKQRPPRRDLRPLIRARRPGRRSGDAETRGRPRT